MKISLLQRGTNFNTCFFPLPFFSYSNSIICHRKSFSLKVNNGKEATPPQVNNASMDKLVFSPKFSSAKFVPDSSITKTCELVSELCRHFYTLGWVSGTGGSISIKVNDTGKDNNDCIIVMAPSGVQKERMQPEDMYILDKDGLILHAPSSKPYPNKPPKCSECCPLFLKAFELRNAGAVIHSHGMETCLATMINPGAKEFRITHMEMIKGIAGHGYKDELVIPIIENTPREYELTDSLEKAIIAYPKCTAVLVRNHGVYIWGDNWIQAKTQAECYHYLFDCAIKLRQMGIDPSDPHHQFLNSNSNLNSNEQAIKKRKANASHPLDLNLNSNSSHDLPPFIVLDIEGTTTPISFVSKILFPYAKKFAKTFLDETYDTKETQKDMELLKQQIEADVTQGLEGSVKLPGSNCTKEELLSALDQNIRAMIASDRKVTALKQLQGRIWKVGYERKEILGQVYEDVPAAFSKWRDSGIKIYIYSSGSRQAQQLLFGNSERGDLKPFISAYFDTTIGHKRDSASYSQIALTLGVEDASSILFLTDIYEEAMAAKQAGLQAKLVIRPGNHALPSNHGFPTITSLLEL